MKEYFKYKFGYVNIDDENLYLTNSGNWQEARETEEKSSANLHVNAQRINRMKSFVFVVIGGITVYLLREVESIKTSIGIVVIAAGLAYKTYQHFSSEFGNRYRIPLHKIQSITAKKTEVVRIGFFNANNTPDFEIIEGLEPRGYNFLMTTLQKPEETEA